MNAIALISQDLFDKIRSRFSNLEMGDDQGNVTVNPSAARFFDFDFVTDGDKLGRVSISINELGSLKVFYGQTILEDQSEEIHQIWYQFLKDMRMFAKRKLLRFDTRDITRGNLKKDDFKFLAKAAAPEQAVSEAKMFGSSKTSYHPIGETMLIVRHSKPVNQEQMGARSRNITALFVQNGLGERFKFPYNHLPGARAMQRHTANGGNPYDPKGQEIVRMCETISKLCKFKRKVGIHDGMDDQSGEIMQAVESKLRNLRETVKRLCNQRYYEAWANGFYEKPNQIIVDAVTTESYKQAFTRTVFAEELVEYFPMIHEIMQEANQINLEEYLENVQESTPQDLTPSMTSIQEIDQFKEWADQLTEIDMADEEIDDMANDRVNDLKKLVDSNIKVGVDALNAIQSLRGIGIRDKELERLIKLAGSDGDLNTVITMWLTQTGQIDVRDKLGLGTQPDTDVEPKADEELPEPEPEPKADEELPEPEPDQELPEPNLDQSKMMEDILRLSGLKK
jgi:hypothetical protein